MRTKKLDCQALKFVYASESLKNRLRNFPPAKMALFGCFGLIYRGGQLGPSKIRGWLSPKGGGGQSFVPRRFSLHVRRLQGA